MKSLLQSALCCVVVVFALTRTADAGLVATEGNPTGGPTAGPAKNGGKTTLTPSPAIFIPAGGCPWILPGLAAQKISKADGWDITTGNLAGDIQMDLYAPWVDAAPAITQGDVVVEATDDPNLGGAVIALRYTPAESESEIEFHWIQVIHTNGPLAAELTYGANAGGGYTNVIDNLEEDQSELPTSPYYDDVHAADSTDFVDNPARPFAAGNDGKAVNFQAQVFLVSGDLENKKLKIYDGVWWGFTNTIVVPEPSTFALAGLGGLALLAGDVRRRLRTKAPLTS